MTLRERVKRHPFSATILALGIGNLVGQYAATRAAISHHARPCAQATWVASNHSVLDDTFGNLSGTAAQAVFIGNRLAAEQYLRGCTSAEQTPTAAYLPTIAASE